jgi:predicted porin
MGTFSVGANTFIAAYERVEFDDAADSSADLFTVQALHNVSDHMYVYVEGYYGDGDAVFNVDEEAGTASDEQTTLAVGGTYYF